MGNPKAVAWSLASCGFKKSSPNSGTITKGDISTATEVGGKFPADTLIFRLLLGCIRTSGHLLWIVLSCHACTNTDLEVKRVLAALHFQTCFASSVQDLKNLCAWKLVYFFLPNISDEFTENTTSPYRPVLLYFISLSHHNCNHAIKCSSLHFIFNNPSLHRRATLWFIEGICQLS